MPVYEQTYKHYDGEYRPFAIAWMVIAASGIKRLWSSRGIKFLLFVSLALFFVNIGRLYLAANKDALTFFGLANDKVQEVISIDAKFYQTFLYWQTFFGFLVALFTGSSQIALDRRRKTLALYLSKPMSKLDYLFGKAAIVFFYLSLVTLIPALLLMVLYAMFSDDWMYLLHNLPLMMTIISYSLLIMIPLVLIVLALSSLFKSTETTAFMFCVVYFLPNVVVPVMKAFTATVINSPFLKEGWELISLKIIWNEMGLMLFELESQTMLHWSTYGLALLGITLGSAMLCYARIQPVEVVR
ncbi:MAG: ABC transporter permease subunit [bacterium]|nr:ABC transporter permease subunit [bacterium]